MKKILLFSFFLMLGLVVSQFLPAMVGESYLSVKTVSNTLLYVCLAFIMINVGREFEMDKKPLAVLYRRLFYCNGDSRFSLDLRGVILYVRAASRYLLEQWGSLERESFAEPVCSPDFAGILFTVLAAAG